MTSTPATLIPRCDDVRKVYADPALYRDRPVYVGNEMPVEEVRAWASGQPGYQEIWVDRDHLGWITVAFNEGAAERQADLQREFPGVGVVAVEVDWTTAELEALQRRVVDELGTFLDSYSAGIPTPKGVVSIGLPVLSEENVAEVERRFAGERVCVEGRDPATLPEPGPQPPAGDGWRLLVDEPTGTDVYRTGIAYDDASYAALWAEIGLGGDPPPADFQTEVVIWFGAVKSGSCPDVRLDDVVVDDGTATVHAEIVLTKAYAGCTSDANPHTYVVAVDRTRLPAGPFRIQLDADDPPRGAPAERTLVRADLSRPGAVAAPGEVGPDPDFPGPDYLESGGIFEPGFPVLARLNTHCGIDFLGEYNWIVWKTAEPMPEEWAVLVDEFQTLELSLLLRVGDPPRIEATAGGVTVTYLPTIEEIPGCD